MLPQVLPAWLGTFIYSIDINLRTSVVLGLVGAGGIGFAPQDALRGLTYESSMGIVLVILLPIAAMEVISILLRRTRLNPVSSGPAPRAPKPALHCARRGRQTDSRAPSPAPSCSSQSFTR